VESVQAVEHDPYRFGLEIDEVERRRRLVKEVGDEVENMRDELLKTVHEAQNKGKGVMNGDVLPDPDSFDDQDEYAAFEQEIEKGSRTATPYHICPQMYSIHWNTLMCNRTI